jgi:TetR/AcrR family transcriptional repressor of nem operon
MPYASGGPDGRAAAAARRRDHSVQRAVEAARELFWRQGYEGTTIEAVAARAGLGPATVYARFGTKGGLLAHLFRTDVEALSLAARADLLAGLGTAEALRRHCHRLRRLLEDRRPLSVAFLGAVQRAAVEHGSQLHETDPRRIAPMPAPLAEILRLAHRAGEVRAGLDPDEVATALTNVLAIRFLNGYAVEGDERLVDVFLHGLLGVGGA